MAMLAGNFLRLRVLAVVRISSFFPWPPISDLQFGATTAFVHFSAEEYLQNCRDVIRKRFCP